MLSGSRLSRNSALPDYDSGTAHSPLRILWHAKGGANMSAKVKSTPTVLFADPPKLLGSPARRFAFVFSLLIIIVFFIIANEDWLTIINYTMIAAIAALALNVLSGYTGHVSL